MAATIGISNSPTFRTQPSSVARLISKPMSLSRIMLCRYRGVWLQYLLMTVSMTMRSLARHFSMMRGGSGAATTPSSSHDRQARFSRLVTSTKYFAGSTSRLGTLLVADHYSFFAPTRAHALIRCARQDPLYARKVRRQFLAARMLAGSIRQEPHRSPITLLPHYYLIDDRLKFEQFQLRVGELFAARSILLDAHQPQLLFQHTNPQLRVLQPAPQLCDELQVGRCGRDGSFTHNGL